MNNLKKLFASFVFVAVTMFVGMAANADTIGVVDLDKILANYTKAQSVSADLQVKEAELQKFIADAQKQLKTAATPLEKKNLEDKLTQDFQTKGQSFKDEQAKQWKMIEDTVYSSIQTVAKSKKIDVVINESSVLMGGIDITDDVTAYLNKQSK
ncbi:MAG: OmpH family outer membrane protein [bacterium]